MSATITTDLTVEPLVSVVIPTHNRAGLITRAVDSVLGQAGVEDLEVIVVDDGSADETAEVVGAIADTRVKLLRLEQNQGGAAARNAGIGIARGRYLALLDSDDYWHPDKLRKQVSHLRASGGQADLVVHTQVRVRRPDCVEIQPRRAKAPGESVGEYLFVSDGHMQTSSLLMPMSLARRALFDPTLRKHQDYDFCLRLEQQGAVFSLLEEPLVDWIHDDRPDRITRRYGTEASEHFLATRRERLGVSASSAFWVQMVFLGQLRANPLAAIGRFLVTAWRGGLPPAWYWRWFVTGAGRRLRRRRRRSTIGGAVS